MFLFLGTHEDHPEAKILTEDDMMEREDGGTARALAFATKTNMNTNT